MARLRHIGGRLKYAVKMVWRSAWAPMAGTTQKPRIVPPGDIGITFIGHSSFLLQMGGKNILIDPVYARWLILLRRLRRPGVRMKDLPPIDLVLLTHAHMDHLNRPTLKRIVRRMRRKYGRAPAVVIPWGNEDLINTMGFSRVQELHWWESASIEGLEITLTPCRHWGTRWFKDSHRGFGGYVLRSGDQVLYDSGDTAYFDGFREIGSRLKPQIALLPIGAYHPDSFRTVHTSPEDALQAFVDLGAATMVPMHYGTFRLSHEPMEEPVPRLLAAAARAGLAARVRVVPEGETAIFQASELEIRAIDPVLAGD
jgi:L-ascorbate metabolism protein UlaG (beta-lactamase superfamily)